MKITFNQCEIIGRVNRIDVRKGLSKAGAEFISATFSLSVEESLIRVESFSMRYKKNSNEELGSYKGIITLLEECKALHKTVREIGESESVEVSDETIVSDINECDAIRFSNYGKFKTCKLVENSYCRDGEIISNLRLEGTYPSRLDEDKKTYEAKADFEVAGKVLTAPVIMTDLDDKDYIQLTVEFPTYTEAYGEREASVQLQEITVKSYDEEVFGYIEENFEKDSMIYINGSIINEVKRVEVENDAEDNVRGFGRHLEKTPQFKTEVNSFYCLLGGYPLDEGDIEDTPALSSELWEKARVEKEQKLAEMQNGNNEPKKVGFGKKTVKEESKKVAKNNNLPF